MGLQLLTTNAEESLGLMVSILALSAVDFMEIMARKMTTIREINHCAKALGVIATACVTQVIFASGRAGGSFA